MRPKITIFILLFLLLFSGLNISTNNHAHEANSRSISLTRNILTVDINGEGMYETIQDAINASDDGDKILIYPGTYKELITINKSIEINKYGVDKPVIQGKMTIQKEQIIILSDNVTIKNIILQNCFCGISCRGWNNSKIIDCRIEIAGMGFLFYKTKDVISEGNFFISNELGIKVFMNPNPANVYNNTFINCTKGIALEGIYGINKCHISNLKSFNSEGATIGIEDDNIAYIDNVSIDGGYIGIGDHNVNCLGEITIENVNINNCSNGIWLMMDRNEKYSNILKINNVKIENITGSGIFFEQSHSNKYIDKCWIRDCIEGIKTIGGYNTGSLSISNSRIENSDIGIEQGGANIVNIYDNKIENCSNIGIFEWNQNSQYYRNKIKNNSIGFKFQDTSQENKVYKNQFIDNTIQAEDLGTTNKWYQDYPIGGNYWSDYIGSDTKKGYSQDEPGSDGFGDSPYVISTGKMDYYPIFVDHEAPVADAGNDAIINEGTIYHFNATRSTDDQLVHTAFWEFDYDKELRTIEGIEIDFLFTIPGIYNIQMTAYDYYGNFDTDDLVITVLDIYNPVAISQGDMIVPYGTIARFNGTGSYDSSGIKEYHWFFVYGGTSEHLTGPTPIFTFEKTGIFEVTLRVIDNYDHVGETTCNVTVPDHDSPNVDAGVDITIDNGEIVHFNGSGTTDDSLISNFTWTFIENGVKKYLLGENPIYQFNIPGEYVVTLLVFDIFDNFGTDMVLVTVIDTIPPVAVIEGSRKVLEGERCQLNGSLSTDNGRIVRYQWSFIDDGPMRIDGVKLDYDFKVKGYHNVTLTVWDGYNLSGNASTVVEVVDTINPIADAGPDIVAIAGSIVTLNGSRSNDNSMIVRYVWTFNYEGNGKELEGEIAQFKFDVTGEYIVTLTCYDQSDNDDEDIVLVTITKAGDVDEDDTNGTGNGNGFPVIIVIIVIVAILLIIALIIFFLLKKKKNINEISKEEVEKDELEQMLESVVPENQAPIEQVVDTQQAPPIQQSQEIPMSDDNIP